MKYLSILNFKKIIQNNNFELGKKTLPLKYKSSIKKNLVSLLKKIDIFGDLFKKMLFAMKFVVASLVTCFNTDLVLPLREKRIHSP